MTQPSIVPHGIRRRLPSTSVPVPHPASDAAVNTPLSRAADRET